LLSEQPSSVLPVCEMQLGTRVILTTVDRSIFRTSYESRECALELLVPDHRKPLIVMTLFIGKTATCDCDPHLNLASTMLFSNLMLLIAGSSLGDVSESDFLFCMLFYRCIVLIGAFCVFRDIAHYT